MKLDNEPAYFHSRLGHKSDSTTNEHNFNVLDLDGMRLEHKTMKGFHNVVFCERNGQETNINQSRIAIHLELASKFEHADSVGDSDNCQRDGEINPVVACTYFDGETEPVQEASDKLSVRECELPELTVCYKESIEHVIKDICVDEGVSCKDGVLFESLVDEFNIDKASSYPEEEHRSQQVKGVVDSSVGRPDERNNLHKNDLDKECDNKCSTKCPIITTTEKSAESNDYSTDKTDFENIKETTSPINVDASAKVSESKSDAHENNEYRGQCTQIPNDEENPGTFASVSTCNRQDNTAEEAALVTTHQSSENAEPEPISPSNEFVSNQAAGNGSSTSNLDITTPESNTGGEHPTNDLRELLENEKALRIEGGYSGRWLGSNRVQNYNGETSFSMNGGISGRISYSGSIPYSGSVSMRSDSSTTSARSFAFPVIQTEWKSSPVRMAKADRKRLHKHRSWKNAVMCCRF